MIAFLIAGSASGVGKTTTALALMAALRRRGLRVQPFKCGPDFLDTSHHTAICGRPSRNLDSWLLDAGSIRSIFNHASRDADVAIAEGMMGLFDGVRGGGEQGSTAEIAKQLGLPVVLVLDAAKSARSIAAVLKGFETFDPELRFAGVVLNGVAGEDHYRLLEQAIISSCVSPILGWLPKQTEVAIPERHLGLRSAVEQPDSEDRLRAFAAFAEAHLDLERLMKHSYKLEGAIAARQQRSAKPENKIRLGVARDRAFSFYYEDNFDIFREFGAELVEFSPLVDALPEGLDALYLGGGYPELYAQTLSGNRSMLSAVRDFAAAGKPIYAECGGMMFLAETLVSLTGESFPMAGVLPLRVQMTGKLVHFGYADVAFSEECLLGAKGTIMRGHSFHFSQAAVTGSVGTAYRVRYSLSGKEEREGYVKHNVLASYVHLHFRGNPSAAQTFLAHAGEARGLPTAGHLR
jgi:cobyrinic acid a,c-diamide synthase